MSKTQTIDLSADRLIAIAADKLDGGNYISALKMLNKNAVVNGNDDDSYLLYAEAFDDMELYEKSINSWFKYLDYAGESADFAEAYEGLAVAFMSLGQDKFAAFYYNKLLQETDRELTPENRQEIIDAFLSEGERKLSFAWPPKLVDYGEVIDSGVGFMRANEYEKAIEQFESVDESNEKYLAARNLIAMCNVINDANEQAEAECLSILKRDPDNVQALTTLAAVKSQQQKTDESESIARRLIALSPSASDDIYKVATVCCENRMHAEAYEQFCRMDEKYAYDPSLLFFKAVSAYNCGKLEESRNAFDTLLTIYPNAVIADYWFYVTLQESKSRGGKRTELEYFYRLPREECETNVTILSTLNSLSDKAAIKLNNQTDLSGPVHWCFDEGDASAPTDLKMLGAMGAIKAGMEDTVRDILLDAFVPDALKMEMLNVLVQRNEENEYGVVICNLFKRVTIVPINIGRSKKKSFMGAYGLAFSRFAMLSPEYSYMLAVSAEKLYAKLSKEGKLDACRNVPAVAAAIVYYSNIEEEALDLARICALFGVNEAKVKAITD